MRWPEFLQWTPEERRAMLAVLLFTGGGGVLIELGRRYPQFTPDFRLTASLDRAGGADSTAAGDATGAPADSLHPAAGGDSGIVVAGLGGWAPAGHDPHGREDDARTGGRPRDGSAAPGPPEPTGPVDLNRAGAGELTRLPGVGPKLAERIVADRAAHGPYRAVADLDRVKGVGPALLQKIAGMAVVSADSSGTRRVP
jgi:competence ComEA-like helix-hairpin-helix protein